MIVGTAGHIDHGKSSLVAALTGRPMDRLAEERRRGITIELGFAPLDLGDGVVAGVVDVPGHEDFVRTMVAGASGVDVAVLVIAADDGIMPQTEEHLLVLEQLRVARVVPVLTKADLADADWLGLLAEEVTARLRHSPLASDLPIPVSARTGAGLDALRSRLRELAATTGRRHGADLFRLPVDRAFSLSGAGTVVTGTARSGRIAVGERVRVLPGGLEARVRSIESFGRSVECSEPGARTALALVGVERQAVERGAVLVSPVDAWVPSQRIDVALSLAPGSSPLRERTRLWVHLGAATVAARVSALVEGGARLRLEQPLVARGGDRIVLRGWSPVTTLGGGEVLDPDPPRRSARSLPDLVRAAGVERLGVLAVRRGGVLPAGELPVISGLAPGDLPDAMRAAALLSLAGHAVAQAHVALLGERLVAAVRAHHGKDPGSPGLPLEAARRATGAPAWLAEAVLDRARDSGTLRLGAGVVALPGFLPPAAGAPELLSRVVARVAAAGLQPPSWAELVAELGPAAEGALREAVRSGRLVAVERDRAYAPAAVEGFVGLLRELGGRGEVTPAALRERAGISRKYLIPMLEWCDRQRITRRDGDGRRFLSAPPGTPRPT